MEVGPRVKVKPLAGDMFEGTGRLTLFARATLAPPQSLQFIGACAKVDLELKAKMIWYDLRFKVVPAPQWSFGDSLAVPCASGVPDVSSSATFPLPASTSNGRLQPEVETSEPALVVTYEPLIGTGAIYEGRPLLAESITADKTNDGNPAIARGPDGEILATWAKDPPVGSGTIGSAVVVASYDGTVWTTPVEIQAGRYFNRGTTLVYDAAGTPMVLWASAPANVTPTSSSETMLQAIQNSDIFFSQRVSGTWTAPQPVAAIPGQDESVKLATNGSQHVATWIHTEDERSTLYSSFWSGSEWSTPNTIELGALADNLSVAYYAGSTPVLVWTQDNGAGAGNERRSELYSATWNGVTWSKPVKMAKPLLAQAGVAGAPVSSIDGVASLLDPATRFAGLAWPVPPEECCKPDDSGDPPNKPQPPTPPVCGPCPPPRPGEPIPPPPPGGSGGSQGAGSQSSLGVLSSDPNEKLGPLGQGTQHAVDAGDTFRYTIYFENKAEATAPAQEVFVTDRLDPSLGLDQPALRRCGLRRCHRSCAEWNASIPDAADGAGLPARDRQDVVARHQWRG